MSKNKGNQQENVKAVFDAFASDYVDLFMDIKHYSKGVQDFVLLLGERPSILDLGCGPGNIASAIIAHNPNAHIIGVDLSTNMIDLAKELVPKGKFYVGDISTPSDYGSCFNGLVLGFVLPYLPPDTAKELLIKVNEVLSSGSYLLALTMIKEETITIIKETKSLKEVAIEMTYYSLPDLKKMLSDSGFIIIQEEQMVNDYNKETEVLLIAKKP